MTVQLRELGRRRPSGERATARYRNAAKPGSPKSPMVVLICALYRPEIRRGAHHASFHESNGDAAELGRLSDHFAVRFLAEAPTMGFIEVESLLLKRGPGVWDC